MNIFKKKQKYESKSQEWLWELAEVYFRYCKGTSESPVPIRVTNTKMWSEINNILDEKHDKRCAAANAFNKPIPEYDHNLYTPFGVFVLEGLQ